MLQANTLKQRGGVDMAKNRPRYQFQNYHVLIILLVSIGMLTLSGCGVSVTNILPSSSPQMQQTSTFTATTRQNTYVVGDTFKIGDLQYKINRVRTSDGDANKGISPRQGNTFLLVDLTIENQGSIDAEVRSMVGFKLKDKDGRSQAFSMGAALAVKDAMDGTISDGGEMTGELGYEVLRGAQTFDLVITPYPLSSKTAIVHITTNVNPEYK